ncbi:MAG: hypothetical protein H0U48_06305 [Euzebyaceae bacterium]|nr:hypothetical protein [Euzebyaceae bacterium]
MSPASRSAPSVWRSLRGAASSLVDDMGSFIVANLIWVSVAALTALVRAVYPPALVAGVLLVPVTCGLTRMAGRAARGVSVNLGQFGHGVRCRFWPHLALGAGQSLLLAVASVNVAVGLRAGRALPILAAVVSGYVALATWLLATAAWPLLLDPQRHAMPLRAALRLAVTVVLRRPVGLVAIASIEAVFIAVTVQTVVPALLLPSYGALLAAHYVLPVADSLEGRGARVPG